jgi:lipid II:glycine glycyltransferase (peptidoglycan interpeptide bridge formation enzyme)
MSPQAENATDARQIPEWAAFMQGIGWKVEKINGVQIFIRKVPFFNHSMIKIQHAAGPFDFQKIDEIAKQNNALFTLLEPLPYNFNLEEAKKSGYIKSHLKVTHTANELIDLRPDEQTIFNSFSENARRNIKKAQKNNITIKHIYLKDEKDDTQFKIFFDLLVNIGKMKKFYIPDYKEMSAKMQAFKQITMLSFAYNAQNEPIAVVWYAIKDDQIWYLHTGITPEGYNLLANYLLVWEGIKEAKKHNVQLFDFEALYDPRYKSDQKAWIGFTDFKKRFHGEIIEYPGPWIKIYNLPYKIIYTIGSIFSRQ